ncbi:1552_t:CDS:2, partial [Racocetra fulgida]
ETRTRTRVVEQRIGTVEQVEKLIEWVEQGRIAIERAVERAGIKIEIVKRAAVEQAAVEQAGVKIEIVKKAVEWAAEQAVEWAAEQAVERAVEQAGAMIGIEPGWVEENDSVREGVL